MPQQKARILPRKKKMTGKGVIDLLKFIKKNKILSRSLKFYQNPVAQAAGHVASFVGLGRRK